MKKNLFTLFIRWVFVLSFFLISSNVFGGKGNNCTPPTKPTLSTGSSVCNSGESFNFSVTNYSASINYKWGYTGGGSLINITGSTNTLSNVTSSGKISVQAGPDDCFSIGAQYIQAINIPTPDAGPNVEICSGLSATIGSNSLPDELTDVIAFQEDFGVPEFPGWTVHNSGGSGTWKHNLQGVFSPETPNTTTASNGYIFFDSDDEGSSGTRYLTLPSIDLSAYTSVRFSMSHYYRRYTSSEIAKLQVSINGGAFNDVVSWTSSTTNPKNESILVPLAVGQSDVVFRFEYRCNWDWYWFIDDIVISGTVPLTYTWDNGLGTGKTKTVNPTSTTTYNLTVSSANGCSASDDVQVIVTNPSGDPSVWGDGVGATATTDDDHWRVYLYNTADALSSSNYKGYYTFKNTSTTDFGFNTENYWTRLNTPDDVISGTNNTAYQGCPLPSNDYFRFVHKRKGFPCGFYKLVMQLSDDGTEVYVNGTQRFSGSHYIAAGTSPCGAEGCNDIRGIFYLDENSTIETITTDATSDSYLWMQIIPVNPPNDIGPGSFSNTSQSLCIGNVPSQFTSNSGVTIPYNNADLANSVIIPNSAITYQWQSSSSTSGPWTDISGANSENYTPPVSNTTMYYRRVVKLPCYTNPIAISSTGTISVPSFNGNLAINNEDATCYIGANETVHFINTSSGSYIASVKAGATALGSTKATAYVESSNLLVPACNNPNYETAVMKRHWVITPTTNGSATVRLPYLDAEFSSLATSSQSSSSPDDLVTYPMQNTIYLSKYSGGTFPATTNVNANPNDNCAVGGTTIHSNNGTIGTTPLSGVTALYSDFNIPGFSEFWLHGQSANSPLPVTLTSFSASCKENVMLSWTTASEQNSDRFVVEKSRDGVTWEFVGEQSGAGNSNTTIHYSQTDNSPWSGVSYYRLRQIDYDGKEEIYGPITVSCDKNGSNISVYPNPNTGNFTVEINSSIEIENADLQLVDLTGKLVSSRIIQITKGVTQVSIGEKEYLSTGTYILKIVNKGEYFGPVKVVVK